jgi:hypothetical protein
MQIGDVIYKQESESRASAMTESEWVGGSSSSSSSSGSSDRWGSSR